MTTLRTIASRVALRVDGTEGLVIRCLYGPVVVQSGAGLVDSVNGQTGVVVLDYSDVGAAATAHTHSTADLVSGTVATARLGSGTADSTKFLRGDQTWATVAGGATYTSPTTSPPASPSEGETWAPSDYPNVMMLRSLGAWFDAIASFDDSGSGVPVAHVMVTSAGTTIGVNGTGYVFVDDAGLHFGSGVDSILITSMMADPSAGAGVAAPVGSVMLANISGVATLWLKAGTGDTDWTRIDTHALDDLTDVSTSGGATGDVLTQQADGTFAMQAPSAHVASLDLWLRATYL